MHISFKRRAAALFFPYSERLEKMNWTSRWVADLAPVRCPTFARREDMYAYLQSEVLRGCPIDYLEFGVADGSSLDTWRSISSSPSSRFWGFDSFRGLPEQWRKEKPKGAFSRDGTPPEIEDSRVSFQIGWFQDTMPAFLRDYRPTNRLVIHNDCDLYSSTLYVLTCMDRLVRETSVVIFDEFWDALHEYRALVDYAKSYNRRYRLIASTKNFNQVAVVITGIESKRYEGEPTS